MPLVSGTKNCTNIKPIMQINAKIKKINSTRIQLASNVKISATKYANAKFNVSAMGAITLLESNVKSSPSKTKGMLLMPRLNPIIKMIRKKRRIHSMPS